MKATKFVSVLAVLVMLSCSGVFLISGESDGSSTDGAKELDKVTFYIDSTDGIEDSRNKGMIKAINEANGATVAQLSDAGSTEKTLVFTLILDGAEIKSTCNNDESFAVGFVRESSDEYLKKDVTVKVEIKGACSINFRCSYAVGISEHMDSGTSEDDSSTKLNVYGEGTLDIVSDTELSFLHTVFIKGGNGPSSFGNDNTSSDDFHIHLVGDEKISSFEGIWGNGIVIKNTSLTIYSDNKGKFYGIHSGSDNLNKIDGSVIRVYSEGSQDDIQGINIGAPELEIVDSIIDINLPDAEGATGMLNEGLDKSFVIEGSLLNIVSPRGLYLGHSLNNDSNVIIRGGETSSIVILNCTECAIGVYSEEGESHNINITVDNSELHMFALGGSGNVIYNEGEESAVPFVRILSNDYVFQHASKNTAGDYEKISLDKPLDNSGYKRLSVGFCYDMIYTKELANGIESLVGIERVSVSDSDNFSFEALKDVEGKFYNKFTDGTKTYCYGDGFEFNSKIPLYTFTSELDRKVLSMYIDEIPSTVPTETMKVSGWTTGGSMKILVNGKDSGTVDIDSEGMFSKEIQLKEGKNTITIIAANGSGTAEKTYEVECTADIPSDGHDNTMMIVILLFIVLIVVLMFFILIFRRD